LLILVNDIQRLIDMDQAIEIDLSKISRNKQNETYFVLQTNGIISSLAAVNDDA
jgi:hypothetical protein